MIHSRPHFLCIGAAKAGTTWFHQMMGLHPGVWMSLLKETHYYDGKFADSVKVPRAAIKSRINAHAESALKNRGKDSPEARYWQRLTGGIWTPRWYENAFNHPKAAGKLCGESTPAYAALPLTGINAIHNELPDVRIIHFIRDPVSRALSALRMSAKMSGFTETAPPDTAWLQQRTTARGFRERGNYAEQIPRWREVFPEDRLLYLPFKDIQTDPKGLMRKIERFLGLPSASYPDAKLSRKVHVGERYEIDDQIVDHLSESLAHQTAFLRSTFSDDFCARI